MARQAERIDVTPLTPEERERWRSALERIKRLSEELLAERGGRPFGPVAEDIAAIREERDEEYG